MRTLNLRKPALLCALALCMAAATAQSDDDWFDDDLFGDDLFEEPAVTAATATSGGGMDLSHGVLFQNGSVKIGGSIDTSLTLNVPLYDPDTADNTLGDNIYASTLTPTADALLYVDARPSQNLRLYTKVGWTYPYQTSTTIPFSNAPMLSIPDVTVGGSTFYVKELFTDFSVADRVFFRFGQHTVSWGTGYFFSPVSDMINSSAIDPEHPTQQVDGSLNLRAQVVFPGTQNCLWAYVVPAKPSSGYSAASYARDTALAAKGELVLGGWELGAGALYRHQGAPMLMLTASGSILGGKVAVFGETVLRYGSNAEWQADADRWADKTFSVQATAGAMYYWKEPKINVVAQYYYDGNADDDQYTTRGHNLALNVSFAKVGTDKLSANVMGIFYFGKEAISVSEILGGTQGNKAATPTTAILSASLSYAPVKAVSLSMGPYVSWQSWSKAPAASLRVGATLGGGNF